VLTPSQMLAALPKFANAPVRQTATAGMGSIDWMQEYLITDDAQRSAFRASAAEIYRPRLQSLGYEVKQGESDDDRLLRSSLIGFFAETLKDPEVRGMLDKQGRAVLGLGGDGKLNPEAAASDIRGTALTVAVQEGGKPAFEAAEKHLRATQDAVLRGQLLGAMGSTHDPKLAEHARGLVFEDGLLRRNEIAPVVGGQMDDPPMRPGLRQWVDSNFTALQAKLAPAGARLVPVYAAGMCSEAEAKSLETTFAERMKTVEGGPRAIKQQGESIRLCAAAREARAGQPLDFAKQ